jgi:hypothetical protein
VHTQWNVGGLGQRTGLRYEACIPRLELALPRWQQDDPRMFGDLSVADLIDDVQVIEAALLAADAERHAAERAAQDVQRSLGKDAHRS